MARLPRMIIPRQPQHIIVRGNNRSEIFCCNADSRFYLEKLQTSLQKKHDCQVHAYVLMTNHVHLLMTPSPRSVGAKPCKCWAGIMCNTLKLRYRRTGTLWEGRYKATLIYSESYLLTCMRYIELNPVRAGMVADPADYPWSSYRFNALGQADDLVTPHAEYHRLGNDDQERQATYRTLFNQAISETQINEIRDATNKAWALGDGRFKERIQLQLARRIEPAGRGGDRKSAQFKVNRVC